jgi:hypothetical protein
MSLNSSSLILVTSRLFGYRGYLRHLREVAGVTLPLNWCTPLEILVLSWMVHSMYLGVVCLIAKMFTVCSMFNVLAAAPKRTRISLNNDNKTSCSKL